MRQLYAPVARCMSVCDATADLGLCCAGAGGADVELQPNASAPLLRTSKARREWIEQEMELCSTSWQYQKVRLLVAGAASSLLSTLCLVHKLFFALFPCAGVVEPTGWMLVSEHHVEPCHQALMCLLAAQVLDGELAQRADATRKLREVQKQLMLLGGLVPPSPVVTAAAAAAARGRGNISSGDGGLPEEAVLTQEAKKLQEGIEGHTRSIKVRGRLHAAAFNSYRQSLTQFTIT